MTIAMFRQHIALYSLVLVLLLTACRPPATPLAPPVPSPAAGTSDELVLASEALPADSSLLAALLPDFTNKTGITVRLVPVAAGQALAMAAAGEADVVLTGDRAAADRFVSEGHAPAAGRSSPLFLNQYFVLPLNPTPEHKLNLGGALAFVTWLSSVDVQQKIDRLNRAQ